MKYDLKKKNGGYSTNRSRLRSMETVMGRIGSEIKMKRKMVESQLQVLPLGRLLVLAPVRENKRGNSEADCNGSLFHIMQHPFLLVDSLLPNIIDSDDFSLELNLLLQLHWPVWIDATECNAFLQFTFHHTF